MSMARITRRTVSSFSLGDRAEAWLWDDELPGFGLRIQRGAKKTYYVQYRTGGRGTATRRVVLGPDSVLSPEEARKEARTILAQVRLGADPARARNLKRAEPTISALCDRYIREHVEAHNKPNTVAEIRRVVENKIKPHLGSTKLSDLTRAKVKEWHSGMSASPYEANRCLAYLSKLMSLASKDWELCSENPCIGIKRFPERKRETFFSDADLTRIGTALQEVEALGIYPPSALSVIRFVAVTGLRIGEALALTWEEVDISRSCLNLKDAKAGSRTVPLGNTARLFLKGLDQEGPYVFTGDTVEEPLSHWTVRKLWDKVRERAGMPEARIHDFRHTAGTYAAQTGANAFAVRDILGHRSMSMTCRYVGKSVDPIRSVADVMSRRVDSAMAGRPSNVVGYTGRKRS